MNWRGRYSGRIIVWLISVIPAQAGIRKRGFCFPAANRIPAFAGMTEAEPTMIRSLIVCLKYAFTHGFANEVQADGDSDNIAVADTAGHIFAHNGLKWL
jgi:hypothetical protein